MINEVFDDDVDVDVEDVAVAQEPKGAFVRTIGDREVWFRTSDPGQFHAWQRYRRTLSRQFDKVKKKAKDEPSLEILKILSDLSEKYDMAVIEFVESLMVDEDDKDHVAIQMINGSVKVNDLMRVLFSGAEDDDAEPEPAKPKPVKKSAANAKRTKR